MNTAKLKEVLEDIIESAEADIRMYRKDRDSDNPCWVSHEELILICKTRKHTAECIKRKMNVD